MFSSNSQRPMLGSLRCLLPLLVPAAAFTFEACDTAESPLAPAEGPPPVAAEVPAPAGDPAAPEFALAGSPERIVFQSYRSGNGDIYRMDPQGGNVLRLTSSADEERVPAVSYDNKRIAYVRPRLDANKVSHQDIYIINIDGGGGHWARSTPSPWHLGDPSWSPDGSRLVLTVVVAGGSCLGWLDLATGQIQLINGGGFNYPGVKPAYDRSGQKIVYIGSGSQTVEQIRADGTGHKVLASAGFILRAAYSPDGKKIAFSKYINGDEEIFVKNLVDGTTRRLTYSAGDDGEPSWSADGTRIAFQSRRSGTLQIWTMNAATGGSLTRLTKTGGTDLYPQWTH